ncbi:MAG: hypothetical protein PHD32_11395 [Eubacteriales bacterium]|nr:hypothetical protein [Eubacteriales bacterium]
MAMGFALLWAQMPPVPSGFARADAYLQVWSWQPHADAGEAQVRQALTQACLKAGEPARALSVRKEQDGQWRGAAQMTCAEIPLLWPLSASCQGVGVSWRSPLAADRPTRRYLLENALRGRGATIQYEDDTICVAGYSWFGIPWQVACAADGTGTVFYAASPAWQGDLS